MRRSPGWTRGSSSAGTRTSSTTAWSTGSGFVNAGSVGRPYEGRPGAFWALLEAGEVDLRHTPYAVEAAAVAVRASGYPQADDVASTLVDPEDPVEVSAYFESLAT